MGRDATMLRNGENKVKPSLLPEVRYWYVANQYAKSGTGCFVILVILGYINCSSMPLPRDSKPNAVLDQFFEKIPRLRRNWNAYRRLFTEVNVRAKTTLLKEGEVPRKIFFVKKGCLRASLHSNAREITFQFFFENEFVASIESFRTNRPSPITIKSVEPSTLVILHKSGFDVLMRDFPELKDFMLDLAFKRFGQYANLFLTYIRTTPEQRYRELLKTNPRIIERVPQHYIASYLGITPVSLSRIRKRI